MTHETVHPPCAVNGVPSIQSSAFHIDPVENPGFKCCKLKATLEASVNVPQELWQVIKAWYTARDASDARALALLYDPAGIIVLPSGQTLRSRSEIEKFYSSEFASKKHFAKITHNLRSVTCGSHVGHVVSVAYNHDMSKMESFLDILARNDDGTWRIMASSWTVERTP